MGVQKRIRKQHCRVRGVVEKVATIPLGKAIRDQIFRWTTFEGSRHVPFLATLIFGQDRTTASIKLTIITH